MKSLSIKQPFTWQIAWAKKTIETRTWPTKYRGKLLICSSQKWHQGTILWDGFDQSCLAIFQIFKDKPKATLEFNSIGTGIAVCVADLTDCRPMTEADERAAMCRHYPGAWAWCLENIRPIEPFPVRGQLGLFEVDDSLIKYL